MQFNPNPSHVMHIDINSCFATIEQQANPNLRGKPVVVAAYNSPTGCILASSIEAKKLGIKTGMRVMEGREIYKNLIVLSPDPWKYRNVHLRLKELLFDYTCNVTPKSIDEFSIKIEEGNLKEIALEIKKRIKNEIGEWITVSIGISTNRYLAKIAAGLVKPDGLVEINKKNYLNIYSNLKLTDLTGIKVGNSSRLNSMGIFTVLDFYNSPIWKLKSAFHSITGIYWYTRLRGWEVDDVTLPRRSYGNSVALAKVMDLSPVLSRLVEKMSARLRRDGFRAKGIHLAIQGRNGNFWHKGKLLKKDLYDSRDFYKEAYKLLLEAHFEGFVSNLAVSCFALTKSQSIQTELFIDTGKNEKLVKAVDELNSKWGDFLVGPATSQKAKDLVLDRIAFGGISNL